MKFQTLLLLIGAAAASQVDASNLVSDAEDKKTTAAPCVYLDESIGELEYQMEMFSRTLDPRHWTNVQNIYGKL